MFSRARALLLAAALLGPTALPLVAAETPSRPAATAPSAPAPAAAPAPVAPVAPAKPDEVQQRIDAWKAEVDQIALGAQRDGQNDRRLAEVRERLDVIRREVVEVEANASNQAAAIDNRLKQLAPATSDKEEDQAAVENETVKAEREQQQKLFGTVDGHAKQAALVRVKVDEIVKVISDKRRERFTRTMSERSRSVLEPMLWAEAAQAAPRLGTGFGLLLDDWFRRLWERGLDAIIATGSALAAIVATLLFLRRRIARLVDRNENNPDPAPLQRAAAAAAIIAVNAVGPLLGLWSITKALDTFDLNPTRVAQFLDGIVVGVAAASTLYGISLAILAPTKAQWRLAAVSDGSAQRLMRLLLTLGIVYGFGIWWLRLMDVLAASVSIVILSSGFLALVESILLVSVLKTAAKAMLEDAGPQADHAAEGRSTLWRWIVPLGWLAVVAAMVAAATGYVALATFVMRQTIRTGAMLGALYVVLIMLDEAILQAFDEKGRLSGLMTRSMGFAGETVAQIGVVLSGLAKLLLIASAVLFVLAPIGVDSRDVLSDAKLAFFGVKIGGLTISLSNILSGLAFLVIGVAVTKGVQGWLDQRFLPRTRLDVGLKNSIRTSFGYVGYVVAVALGFSVVGLDLQNLAIVAGALSVGVGFGLQSIVNNFVSGLILLAERPIKAGDLVEIGSEKGFVRKINVRSTEIETFDRASLIVPNSTLISGNVKNWMHRDLTGRCVVNVGVDYEADPAEVRKILLTCAEENPKVLKQPPPNAFFIDFGESALSFRLMCTVGNVTDAFSVESELRFAIMAQLREKGIEVPYAQRDINLRQIDDIKELIDRMIGRTNDSGPRSTPPIAG